MVVGSGRRGTVAGTRAHHRRQRQALVPLRVGVLLQDPRVELEVQDGGRKVSAAPALAAHGCASGKQGCCTPRPWNWKVSDPQNTGSIRWVARWGSALRW